MKKRSLVNTGLPETKEEKRVKEMGFQLLKKKAVEISKTLTLTLTFAP